MRWFSTKVIKYYIHQASAFYYRIRTNRISFQLKSCLLDRKILHYILFFQSLIINLFISSCVVVALTWKSNWKWLKKNRERETKNSAKIVMKGVTFCAWLKSSSSFSSFLSHAHIVWYMCAKIKKCQLYKETIRWHVMLEIELRSERKKMKKKNKSNKINLHNKKESKRGKE